MRNAICVGLCILFSTVSFAVGRISVEGAETAAPVSIPESGTAEALQGLRDELVALRRALAELQVQIPSRSIVGTAERSSGGLESVVTRLEALIDRFPASAERSGGFAPSGETVGYRSRQELESGLTRRTVDLVGGEDLSDRIEVVMEQVDREHRLWTLQQVLSRYGPPDELEPTKSGLMLQYNLPIEADREQESVTFWILEGIVTRAHLELNR